MMQLTILSYKKLEKSIRGVFLSLSLQLFALENCSLPNFYIYISS